MKLLVATYINQFVFPSTCDYSRPVESHSGVRETILLGVF